MTVMSSLILSLLLEGNVIRISYFLIKETLLTIYYYTYPDPIRCYPPDMHLAFLTKLLVCCLNRPFLLLRYSLYSAFTSGPNKFH